MNARVMNKEVRAQAISRFAEGVPFSWFKKGVEHSFF